MTYDADAHPDLICIGAQKAGTTWLDSVLRHAPQFHLPPIKELHYFSELHDPNIGYAPRHRYRQAMDVLTWCASLLPDPPPKVLQQLAMALHVTRPPADYGANDAWYRLIFAGARPDQCRIDICPSYFPLPEAGIAQAVAQNPALKVLVLVRDPVERTWSHLRMLRDTGTLTCDPHELVPGGIDDTIWQEVMRYSDYIMTVTQWRAQLQPGALRLINYDRIGTEPEAVLAELCDWVGVSVPALSDELRTRIFPGNDIPMPDNVHQVLFALLEPQYDFLEQELGATAAAWRAAHLRQRQGAAGE